MARRSARERIEVGRIAVIWRLAGTWYISLVLAVGAGLLAGYLFFFFVLAGEPKIGVIDIPFTLITEDAASTIGEYLDYARREDSIKAVVINISSPGGGAAPSEELFARTRRLREKKPVVISMDGMVASGGYMMAMGANYTFAKSSSLVGSVGVLLDFPGPFIRRPPGEDIVVSGPSKLDGGSRRHWIGLTDQLKEAFIQMVLTERGERLRISLEELSEARLYSGVDGVRLGLVDAIGGEREAIEKAASLAGIRSYDLVDVNAEVSRLLNQKLSRIMEPLSEGAGGQIGLAEIPNITILAAGADGASDEMARLRALRTLFLPSGIGEAQEEALPGLPFQVNRPNVYYLYVGPSQ